MVTSTSPLLESLRGKLIVSCQAPPGSPLCSSEIIAAMAESCVRQGAVAVRIDSPEHIQAVRKRLPDVPIIGLWKKQVDHSDVSITPTLDDALQVVAAGADVVAIDATSRSRSGGEELQFLVAAIQEQTERLVLADLDSVDNAAKAAKAGVDILGTALYGYTAETKHLEKPGFDLLNQLLANYTLPIFCEGGISTPEMMGRAFEIGAHSVVVGTAITGVDYLAGKFLQYERK